MAIDCEWLDARIAATQAAIEAHETALASIAGGAQSYQLDTGQTRQLVTKATLSSVQTNLNSLYNLLSILHVRRDGGGASTVIPGYP